MKKRAKIILWSSIAVVIFFIAIVIYFKMTAPPGEERISYNHDKINLSIEKQLDGINIDELIKNKESYVIEKSIFELQQAVKDRKISYEEITAICLYRIKILDQTEKGYNSVIEINPDAMAEAKERDKIDAQAFEAPLLYGIPVMLKDNINTAGITTSSGAEALSEFIPAEDAELVKKLKENGAVILGKNNLTEFAGYVSDMMPAGYSGQNGQTLNPFGPLKISPSGSSSGSAVSVAMNFTPVSIGTETDGSIIAPASANSVVGFKPTREKVSGEGIMPLVKMIDTAGPIAKSVVDIAAAYQAISGDSISLELNQNGLQGKTIGLLSYEYNDKKLLSKLRKSLEDTGAAVVDVTIDESGIYIFNNIGFTFKKDFADFAAKYDLPIKNLKDLIEYNKQDAKRRIKYGQKWLEEAAEAENTDTVKNTEIISRAADALEEVFNTHHLDAIAFLNSSGSTPVCAAGWPELTIPFGMNKGIPQGVTFATRSGDDEKLINMGYSFETSTQQRCTP